MDLFIGNSGQIIFLSYQYSGFVDQNLAQLKTKKMVLSSHPYLSIASPYT